MFKKVLLPLVALAVIAALTIGAQCCIPSINLSLPQISIG